MKICPACKMKSEDSSVFCPHDGEILEVDLTSIVDTTLDGQYRIEALLGQGGMGAVYRARHILLGDRVAIKILPAHLHSNPEYLHRFIREGQAARRFHHPNAVTVHDLRTTSDGMAYMVLEYVEGHTLRKELERRGQFSPAEAFEILGTVASALNAAHAMGVVHRDLKPENIMLGRSPDGEPKVKLLDLGIAKVQKLSDVTLIGQTGLTVVGQILGTPHYMSPEQWGIIPDDGNPDIDGRADIYSLGVVFYELVAGRRPFEGKTIQDLAREHLLVEPPALHEIRTDVPEAFSRAIAHAISKERGNRPATCVEFISELRAALQRDLEREPEREPERDIVSGATAATMRVLPQLTPTDIATDRAPARGRSFGLAVVVSLALLLSIGGWLGWKQISVNPEDGRNIATTRADLNANPSVAAASSETTEVMRYWLEVASPGSRSVKQAGKVSLTSGQDFKFHFMTQELGYLYILGEGKGDRPTTFLTANPLPQSGVRTNAIKVGEDFSFPNGKEQWITLDENIGIDKYTIIFSSTPITSPAFLNATAGHILSAKEEKESEYLWSKANIPTTVESGNGPSVIVNLPQAKIGGQPLVFDISIEHK